MSFLPYSFLFVSVVSGVDCLQFGYYSHSNGSKDGTTDDYALYLYFIP